MQNQTPDPDPVLNDQGHIISPYRLRSVSGTLQLPYGWLQEGKLDKRLEVTFMDGDAEDLLGDDQKGTFAERLDLVTAACITRLGPVTLPEAYKRTAEQNEGILAEFKKLTAPDRFFALMAVRRATHGDTYSFDTVCQNKVCGEELLASVNLSDFVIKPAVDAMKREFEFTLPITKRVAVYKVLTGEDEPRMKLLAQQAPGKELTLGLFGRIVSVDGEKLASWSDLRRWPAGDRDALRQQMDSTDAGYSLEKIITTCSKCGFSFGSPLEIGPGFFLPSSVSRSQQRTLGRARASS